MSEEFENTSTAAGNRQASDKISLISELLEKNLPYDIRSQIYADVVAYDHRWPNKIFPSPWRQRKAQFYSLVDEKEIADDPWGPNDEIEWWYRFIQSTFNHRREWYKCHEKGTYEKAIRSMTLGTSPQTVNDFKQQYWDTTVVDPTIGVFGLQRHTPRESYAECWLRWLESNSANFQDMKHFALDFNSRISAQYPIDYPNLRGPILWDSEVSESARQALIRARPTSIQPRQDFSKLCKYIANQLPNIETFHLWLHLSLDDVNEILSSNTPPPNSPIPKAISSSDNPTLIQLIRRIPVKKGGRFIVHLMIDPFKHHTMSQEECKIEKKSAGENYRSYLDKWDGLDGPNRYGKECSDLEKKLEKVLWPISLGNWVEDLSATEKSTRMLRDQSMKGKSVL